MYVCMYVMAVNDQEDFDFEGSIGSNNLGFFFVKFIRNLSKIAKF